MESAINHICPERLNFSKIKFLLRITLHAKVHLKIFLMLKLRPKSNFKLSTQKWPTKAYLTKISTKHYPHSVSSKKLAHLTSLHLALQQIITQDITVLVISLLKTEEMQYLIKFDSLKQTHQSTKNQLEEWTGILELNLGDPWDQKRLFSFLISHVIKQLLILH